MQTVPLDGTAGGAAAVASAAVASAADASAVNVFRPYHKTERTPNKTQRVARKKQHIPQALKWQTWICYAGENFKAKCATPWCRNIINVTNFQAGHRLAEANGGQVTLDNLVPICASCNQSMGTEHFDTWSCRGSPVKSCCFSLRTFWRALTGQRTACPSVVITARPPTPPRTHRKICSNFSHSANDSASTSSLESDACKQGDTYHPPPLQLDHPLSAMQA